MTASRHANHHDDAHALPPFWQRLRDLYRDRVSHAFILHGNVQDYVGVGRGFLRLETFLAERLQRGFHLVAELSPARMLCFATPAHHALAMRALGLPNPQQPALTAFMEAAAPDAPPTRRVAASGRDALNLATLILDGLVTTPIPVPEGGNARVAVLIHDGDLLFPATDDSDPARVAALARLTAWARNPAVGDQEHLLLMTVQVLAHLHSELRRASGRWEAIALPLPGLDQRRRFLEFWERQQGVTLHFDGGLTRDALARATGGLTLLQVEDIALRGLGSGVLTPEMIADRKAAIISQEYADVLSVQDARWTLDAVGGYAYLVEFLQRVIVTPWRRGALHVGGLLLSGPPGTGKTHLAEALAGSAGVPFVTFNLARILGQFVGQSERNLERALAAVLGLAPCVLFIDEIDQAAQRGSGATNQVDNRVFARLLTFLEDPARRQAQVLVVAATNRPDLLDAAVRSRFDRTAPVLPPTAADRAAIITAMAQQRGWTLSPDLARMAAEATNGWTGRNLRDLFGVIDDILATDAPPSLNEAVALALDCYLPSLQEVEALTALALREVSDLRLAPPEYRDAIRRQRHPTPAAEIPAPAPPPPLRRGRRSDHAM